MQFAPDGRLFVCEQGGRLRVIKNGSLLSTPFVTVSVDSSGERGLLGVAFDPNFVANNFVYVYYTATSPSRHNRISRFTANGDVAVAGSEVVIFDFDNLTSATNHNGGALAFGPLDGKLYAAAGDNANGANAQSLNTLHGKIVRLNADGSIPSDNPFFTSASGKYRAIWALGLRNPFTFAFDPAGSSFFINDVGETSWEEINQGVPAANFGWPSTEGQTTNPSFKRPVYAYDHSSGCAITGGVFYSPAVTQFPSGYAGNYFFADYCSGWIRKLDRAAGNTVTSFASGIAAPVDLKVADDGTLYYLARDSGAVYQVRYGSAGPTITSQPTSQTVPPGASVTFSVRASGTAPLAYQWFRDGVVVAGANAPDYTIASVAAAESGARFRARVSNGVNPNGVLSNEATLTVTSNQPPVATIVQPALGVRYQGGEVITFSGTGTDDEDGNLPATAFTWKVDFHHDTHSHPFMAAASGIQSGSITIPTSGETSANVWYRIYLTVRDSNGQTHTTQRDVFPRKVTLTLATTPPRLQVTLDGQPVVTPLSFEAVVGITRSLGAISQSEGGTTYEFASWSDGGSASHTISTPSSDQTYTATYQQTFTTAAPIAIAQSASRDAGSVSSSTLAFPSVNTAGNFIAVAIRSWAAGSVPSVSDSKGNTYRRAALFNETVDGMTLAIFYAENIAGGSNAVTVANSVSGGTLRFAILEYSGVARAGSLDVTAAAQGSSSTPSPGSMTTTSSGGVVISLIGTANARTLTPGAGFTLRQQVPAAPSAKFFLEDARQPAAGSISADGTLSSADIWGALAVAFRAAPISGLPDLTISKTHTGAFPRGGWATYTLTVANAGSSPTNGTVSVTDSLPAGLTATALVGTGWTCSLGTLTCTRSDALNPGNSYPSLTLTVSVAADAAAAVTNTAAVSGGGDGNGANNAASDPTTITSTGSDSQAPTAPGALTAVASGNQVALNWTPASDNVGVSKYYVEQCQGVGCTSFAEIGSADAGAGAAAMGPLRVSANPNYFQDPNGTPLVLNGSHTWTNLQDWGTNGQLQALDFDKYVDFLVAHGHNFTLLWYIELPKFCGFPTTDNTPPDFSVGPHPWQRTGPGNATDGLPKFDLTKFNQAFFDRLRTRVQKLKDAGIYAGVYIFTAEWIGRYRCSTDGYPFTGANNVNGVDDGGGTRSLTMTAPNAITAIQDAYVEKVIDALNDLPNVLWMVSEEAPTNSTWWNNHQIAHVRAYEAAKPYQHPVGYGALADLSDTAVTNSDADWIAPGTWPSPTTSCGSGTPRCKVNVNDSDHSFFGLWNSGVQSHRNFAWQNFMTGNQAMFMDPYVLYYSRENRNACPSPNQGICAQPHSRYDNFRDNLGYIIRYSRRLNLANVLPRSSLCSTGYCLAQTPAAGAEYLVYAPNGGSFTVNLSAMPSSRTLNVEWFNPSTGVTTVASPIQAGSSARTFTPPFQGDAVLYLADTAGHAQSAPSQAVVGTPNSYTVSGLSSGTYRYRVRAQDAAGNLGPYSAVVSVSVQTGDTVAPSAPGTLVAAAESGNQVRLTWSAATDNIGVSGYVLSRCQGSACTSFTQVGAVITSTTYVDAGLSAGTSYVYRVSAVDAAGNQGPSSNTAGVTTQQTSSSPITLLQHVGRDAGSASSSTLAFPSANTAGNWVGVAVRSWPAGQSATVSDSRGNVYRRAVQLNETSDGMTLALFYAENVAGGSNAVTVSNSLSGGTLRFAIFEYAGIAHTNSLDVTASGQGTNGAPTSGSVSTTSAGSLVIGLVSTANSRTFTPGNGYVIQERVPPAPNTKLFVQDLRQPAAGSIAAGGVLNSPDAWAAIVAAFRAATIAPN